MTDCYGREFQIGDRCVVPRQNDFIELTIIDTKKSEKGKIRAVTDGGVEWNLFEESDAILNISAIEREVRERQFLNSVKSLDIKPNDTVIASIIPQQISLTDVQRLYDALKSMLPENKISMVMGIEVTVE